jgi:hypothetical protein
VFEKRAVEPARRDRVQLARLGAAPVLLVDGQQRRYRRPLVVVIRHRKLGSCTPGLEPAHAPCPTAGRAAQHRRERVADGEHTARTHPGYLGQPPVVRRQLELLERLDAELVVDARRQLLADPRHRREEVLGRDLAFEPLEKPHAQAVGVLRHQRSDALADARKLLETWAALGFEDVDGREREAPQRLRRRTVRPDPVGSTVLGLEQVPDALEDVGDLVVPGSRRGHRPLARSAPLVAGA